MVAWFQAGIYMFMSSNMEMKITLIRKTACKTVRGEEAGRFENLRIKRGCHAVHLQMKFLYFHARRDEIERITVDVVGRSSKNRHLRISM